MNARARGCLASGLLAAALAGAVAVTGCGDDERQTAAARPDDAFVVRAARQQQIGLALSKSGVGHARTRTLARSMVRLRERTLGLLAQPLSRVIDSAGTADLGVSRQQAGEDLTPGALRGARPFEPAFLLVMLRHEEGTLTLARAQLQRGKDAEIRAIAQRMSVDAAREMARVRARLTALARRSR